ncbi:MAG: hypothetical protein A2908_01725 [Candidatus Staskawiczbacteria bacterium RIFCSPLOWO2_01_FULL_38_12b]|uniref:AMP-dependent synthetase/ligase domain-containing protein n=1 Tax=Candidatus Staskawiczbacteria bacterium RIFCSPLOWO2_01_FULL_38_12b TaxID=1802214 RepID=A0A1G2IEN6_9BACT|nr:MAG: hypothetical protein A2908_01725 [Candidatus Staskawiczbacteria bacterium RIFCSPLOWO2_01_FULL_38_12b]
MTPQEKLDWLVSPEKFYPKDLCFENLRGNRGFIDAFITHVELLREFQFWEKEKIEEVQLLKLRKMVNWLFAHSKFWSDYFKKNNFTGESLDSIKQLPIITRTDLISFGDDIYVTGENENISSLHKKYTSGTSGTILKTIRDERDWVIASFPCLFRNEIFSADTLKDLFSRRSAVYLGMSGSRTTSRAFIRRLFSISDVDLDDKKTREEMYHEIQAASPAFLVGFASHISRFARYVFEGEAKLSLTAIFITGEAIALDERIFIEKTFGVPVINILSTSETEHIGFECDKNKENFHVFSDRIILETEKLSASEEGEIAITVLDFKNTPIIRYFIQDSGSILSGSCSCKSNLPLFQFKGRRDEEVVLPSGKKIRSINLNQRLFSAGFNLATEQIQIRQESLNHLKILIASKDPVAEKKETRLLLSLSELFKDEKIKVEIERVDSIPLIKERKYRVFVPLRNSEHYSDKALNS